ncbi:MAG: helix-turn-helix domain-containing protein [Micrococcales bacterium]|nr:helix-turn-helix domain-containing protein [Micrococcales bacterium]
MNGREGGEAELRAVATLYYLQDETMDAIGARLGVSRSTVSRMLKAAREEGIVRISIDEGGSRGPLAGEIEDLFGVRAHVVPVRDKTPSVQRLDRVAVLAAQVLSEVVTDDCTIGIAWGTTISAVVGRLTHTPTRGSVVVQLNGAANTHSSGVTYAGELLGAVGAAFDASVLYFPVPAFFDHPETWTALRGERAVQRVLEAQAAADVAVFSVGALHGTIGSEVYVGGYLDRGDLATAVRQGVVGDVCTVLLREDGTWEDIDLNQRASGPVPPLLARIPRRICVVADPSKAQALRGALRAGVATDLIVDEGTARALLLRHRGRRRPRPATG